MPRNATFKELMAADDFAPPTPRCQQCNHELGSAAIKAGDGLCSACQRDNLRRAEAARKSRTLFDVVMENTGRSVDVMSPAGLLQAISDALEEMKS